MNSEIQAALLGILGTLMGTVLGWGLNNFSQHGKLNIFISTWKDNFEYNKTGCFTQSSSIEQTEYYSYELSIDIYNSSAETKIMRNIEIVFMNKKEELYCSIPYDESTRRAGAGAIVYKDIAPINIPPKSVINIDLTKGINNRDESFKNIWNTTHVFLKYSNEKNAKKKVLIKKEKYCDYFANKSVDMV